MNSPRIAFIGAGNMAASLIGGLRARGVPADSLCASNRSPGKLEQLAASQGIQTFSANTDAVAGADIVVLAVKPQIMQPVCRELAASLPARALVISIAAGITCTSLQHWLDNGLPRAIVRCMPNTPSLLGAGISGLYASPEVSPAQRQQAEQLLGAVGQTLWVEEEALLDAVTAVSGSGPAYFFLLVEAMTRAGTRLGLPESTAARLASQTALGAARMACENGLAASELRRQVTSPNGTTEAAINTFLSGGFEALVDQALQAAATRSAELARQLGH